MSNNEKILISACLAGVNCKYNGGNNANEKIKQIISKHDVILVCPEQLGGLTTPRDPAERLGSRVITNKSQDVTENFQRGAEETLRLAKEYNIKKAILNHSKYNIDGKFNTGELLHIKLIRDADKIDSFKNKDKLYI